MYLEAWNMLTIVGSIFFCRVQPQDMHMDPTTTITKQAGTLCHMSGIFGFIRIVVVLDQHNWRRGAYNLESSQFAIRDRSSQFAIRVVSFGSFAYRRQPERKMVFGDWKANRLFMSD
ncbi:hypothetical protein F4680DRAFT_238921 [Xylaria scruposa]|nr:hypothetical protein F4680DRAFT_238921 [Xylaria scruposa]